MNRSLERLAPSHPSPARRRPPLTLAMLAGGLLNVLTSVAKATEVEETGSLPRLLLPAESSLNAAATSPLGRRGTPSVRRTVLNPALVESAAMWLQPDRQFRLDLLANQDITVEVRTVEPTATGGLVVQGCATSDTASTVTLTLHGDQLTGFVALPGLGQFRIAPGTRTG